MNELSQSSTMQDAMSSALNQVSSVALPDNLTTLFLCALIFVFTALSAFFSSTEIAFFSLPQSRVKSWKNAQSPKKRAVFKLLQQSRQLLVLIFMLNTIVNVFLQNATSSLFDSSELGFIAKIGIPLVLILIFGELLPKWIGMMKNERLALFASSFYPFFSKLLSPFQNLFTIISEFFSRIFFFFLKAEPALSSVELESIVKTAIHDGVLKEHEAHIIANWLDLDKKTALDVMIPRSEVDIIEIDKIATAPRMIHEKLLSKTPSHLKWISTTPLLSSGILIGPSNDKPEGFLNFCDIFPLLRPHSSLALSDKNSLVEKATKQLFFVPETMPLRKLINEFEERKTSIASVIDEHGMVLGYIRPEMIRERLAKTHEISHGGEANTHTPHLSNVPTSHIQITNHSSLIASGSLSLDAVNAFFGTHLTSRYRSTTIGGWIIEQLDTIPPPGTKYVYDNLSFRVLASDATKVKKIFIHRRKNTLPLISEESHHSK